MLRRRLRRVVLALVLGAVAAAVGFFAHTAPPVQRTAGHATDRPVSERAHVAYVIDGDTIVLADGRHVRYIGIDTPELRRRSDKVYAPACYAREATARNRALVAGKDVRLERDVSDTDRYGRLLRYVFVGDTFVNAALVREGFARAKRYPPDTARSRALAAAEEDARAAGRGLWRACR